MKMHFLIKWILRLIPAVILLQTLFFKFTAHPDSVAIFETVGLGAAGRIGLGVVEMIAAILILTPRLSPYGALLAVGMMIGAIGAHLSFLGIEVNGDGGKLFVLALVTFITALVIIGIDRNILIDDLKNKLALK